MWHHRCDSSSGYCVGSFFWFNYKSNTVYIKVKLASYFEVALYIVVTFVSSGCKLCKTVYCICVTTFWFVTKMTTVQTIGTVPLNAVPPSTPANWLYLESDCDGLSSDQVQTFCILTHLIWPPMSTLQGIDRAPYIVGSVRNQAQQLLRRRTPFTRWMWHKT